MPPAMQSPQLSSTRVSALRQGSAESEADSFQNPSSLSHFTARKPNNLEHDGSLAISSQPHLKYR